MALIRVGVAGWSYQDWEGVVYPPSKPRGFDPLTYLIDPPVSLIPAVATGIDFRARNIETIEELRRDSIDFYARIRSVYLQRRIDEINNGEPSGDDLPAPGLTGDEPGKDQFSIFDEWPDDTASGAEAKE